MKQFLTLYKKVGGTEILKQYRRAHVLVFAGAEALLLGFSKKSLEILRLAVNNRILCRLRKQNRKIIREYLKQSNDIKALPQIHSKKVWVCWFQGLEEAPDIVKMCYGSLQAHLKDREIVLLTEKNYREYVQFPEYIEKKIENGSISRTHMSDLLRLELLIRYGGTWVDATVFCSGAQYPEYFFDADLFVFQCLKPGLDGHSTNISSWFMTASSNHPILLLTRELLYRYWDKHSKLVDYFIIHDFFQLAIEAYPEEWERVVPFSNSIPHMLLLRLFKPYRKEIFDGIMSQTCIHKLTYKFNEDECLRPDTNYAQIMKIANNWKQD